MKNPVLLIVAAVAVLFSTTAANAQQILRSVLPVAGTSVNVASGGPVVENGYGSEVNAPGWEDQLEFPALTAYAGTPSVGSTLTLYSVYEVSPGTTTFPLYTINLDLTQNFTFAQYEAAVKTQVGMATAVPQADLHTIVITGLDGYVNAVKLANVDLVFGYAGFSGTYFDNSKTVLNAVVPEPHSSVILILAASFGAFLFWVRRPSRRESPSFPRR